MLRKQAKTLSKKQIEMVVAYLGGRAKAQRNTCMFLLSVRAGLRAIEISKVQWKHLVDSEGNLMKELHLPNVCAKGNSGRIVPLHKDLYLVLSEMFDLAKDKRSFSLDDTVIQSQKGGSMNRQSVVNWFKGLYSDLGVIGASSHSGRRTAITHWARSISTVGGSLRDVQSLAGHSSLSTTQHYIEFDSDAQRKVIGSW